MDPTLPGQPWYHGLLPRDDIKGFLQENGDFLVRMTEPSAPGKRELVLSVMYDKDKDHVKHFVINKSAQNKYFIEKMSFDSVALLIQHHLSDRTSITTVKPGAKEVILKNPVGHRAWELSHSDIEIQKKLGEGAYGEVHKGVLKVGKKKRVDVAIKQAKLDALTKEQIKEIMREARLMRFFDHPHIVKLHGVAAGGEPLMLVMELASNGALDSYLQKNTTITIEKKMEMILQAAWGIEYLHEKNCLHRDIAARNCLYGDGKVKISDFGLSRSGTVYQMDPRRRVPIRWLAPETLRTAMYTQKTDVFSYGILCWEILNNGQEPYPEMTVAEVNARVKDGYRMPLPPSVGPESTHLIEVRCWSENPNERLPMNEIAKQLEKITKTNRPDFATTSKVTRTRKAA